MSQPLFSLKRGSELVNRSPKTGKVRCVTLYARHQGVARPTQPQKLLIQRPQETKIFRPKLSVVQLLWPTKENGWNLVRDGVASATGTVLSNQGWGQ